MTVFPLIIDAQAPYLQGPFAAGSILAAPMGCNTLLQHLGCRIARASQEGLTVLATFPIDAEYEATIRHAWPHIDVIASVDAWHRVLTGFEPSDWILLIDPRRYPVRGFDLAGFLQEAPQFQAAQYLVAMDTSEQGTKEYIQLDPEGRVSRVRRYYEGVTWLQATAVPCCLVSASCLRLLERPTLASLLEVRSQLASCGVPSQDILLRGGSFDLNLEADLLRLTEQSIVELGSRRVPPGYRRLAGGVLAAHTCRIAPTARIHGPAILQDRCVIEAAGVVIGPTVIGTDSSVEEGAVVAQCLVMRQSVIPRSQTVRQRVVCHHGGGLVTIPAGEAAAPPPRPVAWPPLGQLAQRVELALRRRWAYTTVKRWIDVTFAGLGLLILAPLLAVVAVLIKLDSPGPLLFGHEREGRFGRVFRCWKFRTMITGAQAKQRALYKKSGVDGPQFKLDNDPRVTRIGWLLRATNIDELPQLFNVLAGQMSLIGPRPSPFRENQICIPWRQARLSVLPGITGLWQICRSRRASGDFHQWIYYDMLYVRHISLALDLKILLATVLTMGGRWGVPVTWLIPVHTLYCEGQPCRVPSSEQVAPDTGSAMNTDVPTEGTCEGH